jgi:hypothetical protein
MSWLAQVRHVAWKDIRQSRWILLVYVLIVTLATEQIVGPIDVEVSFLPTTLLLVLLGIAGSAVFVQSDSPSRSDAFWASRPFYGSALAAEKVTMLALLLAIGLGGEIIALEAFHVATGEFVATLAASVLTYGAWLLAAAMLGAVTRDLRTFTVSIIVVVVVSGIAGTTLLSGHAQEPVIRLLAFIGAVLGLIVFTLMYERRTRSRALWVLAVVAVLAELYPYSPSVSSRRFRSRRRLTAPSDSSFSRRRRR